jgi:hypothetical protein
MQCKILVCNEDDSFEYVDVWLDENKVIGYYLTKDNFQDESVNLIFGNTTITLLRSKELIDFLLKKFNM